MSAFMVEEGTINCIVQSLVQENMVDRDTADTMGRMLIAENRHSVDYRYQESSPPYEADYVFRGIAAALDPRIVIEQVACYRYQSCEHPGWAKSPVCGYIENLLSALQTKVLRYYADNMLPPLDPDSIPWGISHIDEAVLKEIR